MLYSRPNISALGWDLQAIPTPNGSKNFEAMTVDGRPVDFRFSSGWIIVKIGPKGASHRDSQLMETVVEQPIAPFGTMEILPEQICDILSLTIQGVPAFVDINKVIHERGFDWSGKTTVFQEYMQFSATGILEIYRAFNRAFSDVKFIRVDSIYKSPAVESKCTLIQEDKILDDLADIRNSRHYRICLDCLSLENFKDAFIATMPLANLRDNFKFSCTLGIRIQGISPTYKIRFPHIEFPDFFSVELRHEYHSDDSVATSYVDKMIRVLNEISFKDVEIIDLSTNLPRPKGKWEDYCFSNDLREWCSGNPNRYLLAITYSVGSGKEDWRYCAIKPANKIRDLL